MNNDTRIKLAKAIGWKPTAGDGSYYWRTPEGDTVTLQDLPDTTDEL